MFGLKQFSKRVLEPYDRISEVLFGLIMVLTFTGSLSVAQAGRGDIRTMLIGALGCNLAWGIIDGVFYLMGVLAEKNRTQMTLRALRKAADPRTVQGLVAGALPPLIASQVRPEEYAALGQRLRELPESPGDARLCRSDWLGGLAVFLLVFLCTFPVVLPFVFMQSAYPAKRLSNAIAVGMLFIAGAAYGRCVGRRPWVVGILMVVLGIILVGLTIALGG